jgi:hypothetical protein
METRLCKICGVSSDINKFRIRNDKICSNMCLKCISKKNNEKLRNKESGNYYIEYYKKNIAKFKINDKARYDKNKEIKKLNGDQEEKILNPQTNRMVSINGKVGRKIKAEENEPKLEQIV